MRPSPLRHPARLAGASLLRLQTDTRLAELATAGHEAAFDAIVDRYRTPLLRHCSGIVGPSRAEDAVQQTLINAHDALQRTDEVRHLRSWLYRIAHNASLNVLRAVRDDVSLEQASLSRPMVAPSGHEPVESFERSERFRATVAALQELPERQRAAIVLRELEGRSHEEIADALGVTKGSARQHLMRARTALRGAVTAVTPYPVLVKLTEALAAPAGAGWADAAVGAGTGATLAKLTAGLAATGVLVGGAAGTREVVHHHRTPSASAAETPGRAADAARAAAARRAAPAAVVVRTGATSSTGSSDATAGPARRRKAAQRTPSQHRDRRGRRRDDHPKAAVAPQPSSSGPGSGALARGEDDDRDPAGPSPSAGKGSGSGKDDKAARHGSRQGPDSSGKGASGKGSSGVDVAEKDSSGEGSHDKPSGSSGKGKREDAPATAPVAPAPTVTAPTTTTGSSGPGAGDAGSSGSGSASGDAGSPSGGSGDGSGSSGDDGSTSTSEDD